MSKFVSSQQSQLSTETGECSECPVIEQGHKPGVFIAENRPLLLDICGYGN